MTTDPTTLSESSATVPSPNNSGMPPATAPPVVDESAFTTDAAASSAVASSAPVSSAAALPEAAAQEPPRSLVPGAFLRSEFEVQSVIARGMTNVYLAQGGDYGAPALKLIAERNTAALPQATLDPVTETEPPSPPAAEAASNPSPSATVDEASASGAFVEDVDALPTPSPPREASAGMPITTASATPASIPATVAGDLPATALNETAADAETMPAELPVTAGENESGTGESSIALQSPLFLPHESFAQDDREYLIFDFFESESLQDHREPTNDERLLAMLGTLADGLRELEENGLRADITTDTLRVDGNGSLRYVGFVEPQADETNALEQLRQITAFLLKHVFAESSTMRLDDQFAGLALSEEVKELARQLSNGEFESVARAAEVVSGLYRPGTTLRAEAALLSDVGQERELNEDSGLIVRLHRAAHLGARSMELYVVADGMGGHEGGEVASDLTLSSLQHHLEALTGLNWNDNIAVRNALVQVIDAVNADVVALTETPKYRGTRAKPGSTLTFALRLGARVFVGNVGDSRAYRCNAAGLQRITKDHSYVQTLIDRGDITEEEAWDHPEGSIITAHIGYPKLKLRDVFLRLFRPGDKLLLVSDGVVDMLRDSEIAPYLQENDPSVICRNLVDASNAAGGADNITVVCVVFS
jgi:PPM family protein phosphatase